MNYFLDTSALVKIYHRESGTDTVLGLYQSTNELMISELSQVEFVSSVHRKYRECKLTLEVLHAVVHKFEDDMRQRYTLLPFSSAVIEEANRLLLQFAAQHALKTQDSLQLAFGKTYRNPSTIFGCADMKFLSFPRSRVGMCTAPIWRCGVVS